MEEKHKRGEMDRGMRGEDKWTKGGQTKSVKICTVKSILGKPALTHTPQIRADGGPCPDAT